MVPLIVFSHLRWNFVYQRPQHLLSRLAKNHHVHFIEEPVFEEGASHWNRFSPLDRVTVHQPFTSEPAPGFDDRQLPALQKLIGELQVAYGLYNGIVWLYTPMALPLINDLRPHTVVYDCMDELAAFNFAPLQLEQRERALLMRADLVFTGGPSLMAAKSARRSDIYCFPSSVDARHFEAARTPAPDHSATEHRPKIGYFGVIDERMDIELLDMLTVSHPDWDIDMIGPVLKIDPASLPQAPNIRYLGLRAYDALPRLMVDWDVCILPFALNASTRFISPTKTLEYLAAGKAIVSTPLNDVVSLYGKVVRVGGGLEFVRQCELALLEAPAERLARQRASDALLADTSWDKTAEAMLDLLEGVGLPDQRVSAHMGVAAYDATGTPRVIIIGAGPTGLSAAYHIGKDSLLLEQQACVGGWCRSVETAGFTFDCAGHIMFSNDEYVHRMYELLLGDNVHWQDREAWIYSKETYTRYPFQGALYGLPPDVISECLIGAIEARSGNSGKHATGIRTDFEDFIFRTWGAGIAKHFAIPYNRKLWAVPLTSMETSWLGGRVPMPDLKDMIQGALQPVAKPMGPNARFGYPLRGGFQALMNGFVPHLQGQVRLNASVVRVIPSHHRVVMADGTILAYQQLISTMPLPVLIGMIGEQAPLPVRQAAAGLRHVSVRCVNLGIGRERLTDKHWIYYPERSIFHRIFVQGNASPHCNPPGGFGLTCEITYSPEKPLPCEGDELIARCIRDCIKVGMIDADDPVLTSIQVDMPYAYVVYDHERAVNVKIIREWASTQDIVLAGRYSEWEYYNSDHAFLAGRAAARSVMAMAHDAADQVDAPEFANAEPMVPILSTAP